MIFLTFLLTFSLSALCFGQKSYRTLVYEGNQKFNASDFEGASARYVEAIKTNQKDFTAHYNLGNALYKNKKYEEALAELQKAEKLSSTIPDKAAALHNIGNTYMQMNQPEKAAEFYKQSLKQEPYSEATRKNYEIAKLKEKQNQQKKDQKNKSGKGGGGEGKNKEKGNGGDPKDQGNKGGTGVDNQSKGQEGNQSDPKGTANRKMPKGTEDAILDKVGDKEKETAKKILNKNTFSMPESNEKDW
ncbi:aerotolerance regulator BatC [Chryseobacterium sp. Leaf180]|nr:aerotolerance regulator BatC [Chryseobacterium sp. Leaf180]